jgi:hypothetical protein
MSPSPDDEIQRLVRRLDQLVERDGAVVKLEVYGGGPDETRITGTKHGYLRLGIEMLTAAYLPPRNADDPSSIGPEIAYLIHQDSTVVPNWFQRVDRIGPEELPPSSALERLVPALVTSAMLVILGLAVVGLVQTIRWVS